VPVERAIFAPLEGYARTIVLAPAGLRERFATLESVADVLFIGEADARELDLRTAFAALRARGIASVLCEGGPTLAAHLLEMNLVDRVDWLVAPALLSGPTAVPALSRGPSGITLDFDRVERLGPDVLFSAVVK
jgi:riboflavin biosynthesis pyrimidine reductase